MTDPVKLLAKLQSAGVVFQSQDDGTVKVRKEGGLNFQETQELIGNREALEEICVFTELRAYALIDQALKYMSKNAERVQGKRAHDSYIDEINKAVEECDMPALRWYIRSMVREAIGGSK